MKTLLRSALLVALLLTPALAGAGLYENCHIATITADGTYPDDEVVINTSKYASPVAAWLKIVTNGSGTPSVAVRILGPGNSYAERGSALLGTLNSTVTHAAVVSAVQGVQYDVTGCTNCSLRVAVCGLNQAGAL